MQRISGERRVNQGGEPGHDDYGLPRVDIQVPDDARELYRDFQAYHRELRAIRRQERSRRWRAPLRRSGLGIPLIAGCLVVAMIAGMVLTMFSASPYFSGTAGRNPGPLTARHAGTSAAAGNATASANAPAPPAGSLSQTMGVRLPVRRIRVAGKPVTLSALTSTALAIIPAGCGCATAIRRLVAQARAA